MTNREESERETGMRISFSGLPNAHLSALPTRKRNRSTTRGVSSRRLGNVAKYDAILARTSERRIEQRNGPARAAGKPRRSPRSEIARFRAGDSRVGRSIRGFPKRGTARQATGFTLN